MSPIPGMYKGSKIGAGSSTYVTTGNFKRTGTTRGFSSAPPPVADKEEDLEKSDEFFYDLFGLAKILRKDSGE